MTNAQCQLHHKTALGPCTRCGTFVCEDCVVPGQSLSCARCRLLGAVDRVPTPWERRAELGYVQGLFQTWKMSLFQPDTFYRSVQPEGSTRDAMIYGWLMGLLVVPPNVLYNAWNFESFKAQLSMLGTHLPPWFMHLTPVQYGLMVGFLPMILYPLSFFITVGIIHLGCAIFGANKYGFGATARAVGYAQGPILAAWIPVVGGLGAIYIIVLQIFGVARMQEVSGGRATLAVLIGPVLFACVIGCIGGFAIAGALSQVH